jgi:uncharacterized protein YndB with AHSA1/START domain
VSTTTTDVIRKEVRVEASPERAFQVFTEQIATWWPLDRYSLFAEEAEATVFETRVGGRLYERTADGRESDWGEVLECAPPTRLRFTWHPGRAADAEPTEVEVRFHADGDGTLVTLEHRGWERLSDERRAARAGYDSGWNVVLERYRQAASA